MQRNLYRSGEKVSTHSRPKAAGSVSWVCFESISVSTHSRPKAAGREFNKMQHWYKVSTHSRLKAAGNKLGMRTLLEWFQHTAA